LLQQAIWDRSWNIIFNSIFWQFPHFGQLVGSYEDYEKAGFYVANRQRQKYRFAGYFVYGMAYYSVITAFLRLHW
jgi:heme O synthase-like polyprenyltransferase